MRACRSERGKGTPGVPRHVKGKTAIVRPVLETEKFIRANGQDTGRA